MSQKKDAKTSGSRPMHGGRGGAGAKPKNTKKTLGRLLSYLSAYKFRLIIALICLFVSTAAMIGFTALFSPLINDFILPGDFVGLARMIGVLILIALVDVSTTYIQYRSMITVSQKITNLLRKQLFAKIQSLPLKFFDSHPHGEIMSNVTNDVDAVLNALEQSAIQLFASILVFIGTIGMMFVLNPLLALISVLVLILMLFVSMVIGKRSQKGFIDQQQTLGELNGYVEEMLKGQKVIKVFTREKASQEHFAELNEAYRLSSTAAQTFAGIIMPIAQNLGNVAYALTAAVGGAMIVGGFGTFSIGSLAAFLVFSRQFSRPIQQISSQMNSVFSALAGAERIFDVLDQTPEVDDGTVTLIPAKRLPDESLERLDRHEEGSVWAWRKISSGQSEELVELKGDVRFHDVTFGYDEDHPVLKNMSLYAKPGQKIAFVGSTGAGKTTITNLINRFYDVQKGYITYDGIDVKDIKKADLRHSLGIVLQDTHLFTGTIAENIRYGKLGATDEEVVRASKTASAHSFIKRLPHGYQTVITGDGSNLSQGQRQLLSIARAAVADPPVLILDEATSSIDTRTEKLISRGMDALMENRTVFVIAHRLSTVRNAKAIMVLEHGEIIERGDQTTLIEQKGYYYKLYTGQFALE